MRLLIVCLGNICRSPMAEGALRARLEEAGLASMVTVDSAGTGGWHAGEPPDRRAIAAARGHGVDIGDLRARQLRAADFARFDWLLGADRQNLRDMRALAPSNAAGRIALFMEWAGLDGAIPDPYTGDADDFEHVWRLVDGAARAIAQRLRATASTDRPTPG